MICRHASKLMLMNGHERFRQRLGDLSDQPVSNKNAADAHHNLSGFMSLLIKINEREQIVPTKSEREQPNDNQ